MRGLILPLNLQNINKYGFFSFTFSSAQWTFNFFFVLEGLLRVVNFLKK